MQEDFWQRRWTRSEIAFHQLEVNPYLQRYFHQFSMASTQILVPLCGKSLDLLWLTEQGHAVLGVELSEIAVQAFFSEQQIAVRVIERGVFKVYQAETIPLEIWCGDFFQLTAQDVANCQFLYDRAALIALPPEMRQDYTRHLSAILPPQCQEGLLITLEYPQHQMKGPPFSVMETEVHELLHSQWNTVRLEAPDVSEEHPRFAPYELAFLNEPVYRLKKRHL